MKILVVGGGGREHAITWALHREDPTTRLFCAPGNPGTSPLATNLPLDPLDREAMVRAASHHDIDFTVIGPEAPLAAGLADHLRRAGHAVFGPGAAAARLEASKTFAKEIMQAAGVPTARAQVFTDPRAALACVARHPEPLVIKASGLAGGKGAIVCETRAEAARAIEAMLVERRFGEAGREVLVEEFLEGEETSILAVTDGTDLVLLPPSQDHKRLLEGDTGPNTGGMGAYSPVSLITGALLKRIEHDILVPVLEAMRRRAEPFQGLLYAGLMIDHRGCPWVVEFNCRFGDPEAQVVLPLLSGGLTACLASVAGGGPPTPLSRRARAASVTTVLAARGYPAQPEKGAVITIPEALPPGVTVFHAGTTQDDAGRLRVSGGRVLNVTAVAATFDEACRRSQDAATRIAFEGKQFRRDIGWREVKRTATV